MTWRAYWVVCVLTLLVLDALGCAVASAPDHCLERSGALEQAACFSALASQKRDVAMCQRADAIVASPDCFGTLALSTHDAKHCGSIKQALGRQRCLLALTAQDHKPEACRLIENPGVRDSCYLGIVTFDPKSFALCAEVARKDACYRLAALRDQPQLCQRVGSGPDAELRRACFTEALQPSNHFEREDCLGIDDSTPKEECLAQVAARTRLADDCESITNRETADACWYYGAGNQPKSCTRIQNSDLKHRCALEHWHDARAPELCGLLGSKELEQACTLRFRPAMAPSL